MAFPSCSLLFSSCGFVLISSQGEYGRELDGRRSSVAPRGATSATVNGSHDIDSRHVEDFSGSLGFPASPLGCKCDVRTSIDVTAVFDITATALSTHNTTQPKFETTGRAPFLSLTLTAGSPEQQAASSNAAARTSIDATAVFDITATALSTHNTTQPKFETTGRAPFLSPTLTAGSPEQ